MVGPCLPNLSHLRLVNVALGPGFSDSPEAFFSLHYGTASQEMKDVKSDGKKRNSSNPNGTDALRDLLYVSECVAVNGRMNFGVISLPTIPQQSFHLRLQIWVSSANAGGLALFYESCVDVRNCVLLPRPILEKEGDSAFAANAVVWNFGGSEYCLKAHLKEPFRNMPKDSKPLPIRRLKRAKNSYTVDDVRHLSSLIIGLRDFAETKENTSVEIDHLLGKSTLASDERDRLVHAISSLDTMRSKQETTNETLESQILDRRNWVKKVAQAESEFPSFKALLEEKQEIVSSQVDPLWESLATSIYPHILTKTQEKVAVLLDAFPIALAESGRYSISGIEFPSSIKEILSVCYRETPLMANPSPQIPPENNAYLSSVDCVNAGLSEIVAVLNNLSHIMGISLKYDMSFSGSQSCLVEHLSPQQVITNNKTTPVAMHVSTTVTYPLWYDVEVADKAGEIIPLTDGQKHPRNVRFERGLALLNRNLSFFIAEITDLYKEYHGDSKRSIAGNIPLDCLDHFLWNLHYLMLFVTAPGK